MAAERAVLHALGGGCSVPVGAMAVCRGATVALTTGVFAVDGTRALRAEGGGTDAAAVGTATARRLLEMGAAAILAASDKTARVSDPAPTEVS